MAKLERSLTATFDTGGSITVRLDFDDRTRVVKVFAETGVGQVKCSWKIDIKKKSLQFTADRTVDPKLICIVACLGKDVGKALLECLLNSTTLAQVVACFKGKVSGVLAGTLACIAVCLSIS
ncbi:hypothetical protein ACVII1_006305 [Bradyrhizobium elkanii]